MADIRVDVGSLSFSSGSADGNGTMWVVSDLDGWDMAEVRQSWHNKLGAHGAVVGESQLGTQTVVIKGVAWGTSQSGAWASYNAFYTALKNSVTTPVTITVYAPTGNQTLTSCYLAARVKVEWVGDRRFRFQFEMKSGTPR